MNPASVYKEFSIISRVIKMARPLQYVFELTKEEAQRFLDDVLNPKPNPARDATIERARRLNIEVRQG